MSIHLSKFQASDGNFYKDRNQRATKISKGFHHWTTMESVLYHLMRPILDYAMKLFSLLNWHEGMVRRRNSLDLQIT